MAAPVIAGITLALSAGSTAYSAVQASDAQDAQNRANDENKKAQAAQLEEQKAQQSEMDKQKAQEEADASNLENRNSARARQRALAVGAYGRSSTILTGPLGIPNIGGTLPAGKTVLGS